MRKMINIINILKKHFKRLTKYAMVGATGFILDVILLFCFTQFVHIWYVASEILATLITFVTNYIGNTIFTYRDAMKKLNEDKQKEGSGMSKKVLSLKEKTKTLGEWKKQAESETGYSKLWLDEFVRLVDAEDAI